MRDKDTWMVILGLTVLVLGIYTIFFVFASLDEKREIFFKNQDSAIMTILSKELSIPPKEIVLKKDNNENEENEFYTATTSKGVYQFKITDKSEWDERMKGISKPVIEHMAQVKMGFTDK
ncbi:hypothetical protein [Bacillus sp. NPDC094106]|uniref:hypothetical protein n=1 Tax=Bacillus sp. NPDC094106 TaxID=3363949 RepID=UPI00382C33FB